MDLFSFRQDMIERDIEEGLVQDITKLLLELGTRFIYIENISCKNFYPKIR